MDNDDNETEHVYTFAAYAEVELTIEIRATSEDEAREKAESASINRALAPYHTGRGEWVVGVPAGGVEGVELEGVEPA
jgi:hypothetical protein